MTQDKSRKEVQEYLAHYEATKDEWDDALIDMADVAIDPADVVINDVLWAAFDPTETSDSGSEEETGRDSAELAISVDRKSAVNETLPYIRVDALLEDAIGTDWIEDPFYCSDQPPSTELNEIIGFMNRDKNGLNIFSIEERNEILYPGMPKCLSANESSTIPHAVPSPKRMKSKKASRNIFDQTVAMKLNQMITTKTEDGGNRGRSDSDLEGNLEERPEILDKGINVPSEIDFPLPGTSHATSSGSANVSSIFSHAVPSAKRITSTKDLRNILEQALSPKLKQVITTKTEDGGNRGRSDRDVEGNFEERPQILDKGRNVPSEIDFQFPGTSQATSSGSANKSRTFYHAVPSAKRITSTKDFRNILEQALSPKLNQVITTKTEDGGNRGRSDSDLEGNLGERPEILDKGRNVPSETDFQFPGTSQATSSGSANESSTFCHAVPSAKRITSTKDLRNILEQALSPKLNQAVEPVNQEKDLRTFKKTDELVSSGTSGDDKKEAKQLQKDEKYAERRRRNRLACKTFREKVKKENEEAEKVLPLLRAERDSLKQKLESLKAAIYGTSAVASQVITTETEGGGNSCRSDCDLEGNLEERPEILDEGRNVPSETDVQIPGTSQASSSDSESLEWARSFRYMRNVLSEEEKCKRQVILAKGYREKRKQHHEDLKQETDDLTKEIAELKLEIEKLL